MATFAGIVPMMVLHAALLPPTAFRLVQFLRLRRRARATLGTGDAFGWIAQVATPSY